MVVNIDVLKKSGGGIVAIRDYLLELQSNGQKVGRLESGDPSFDIPDGTKEAIQHALINNKTHYTPGAGIPELRKAIVSKLQKENKLHIESPSSVIVTSGAMNALYVVFQGIAQKWLPSKSKVLVPTPTWTETVDNVQLAGLTPIYYTVNPFSDSLINLKDIEDKIGYDTVAVVINTPHNPTGAVLNNNILKSLIDLCKKHSLYLIADEAYEHIVYEPFKHVSAGSLSDYDKIISIFSCSKSYAMSGLRVGYAVIHDGVLFENVAKMVRCTINGVNSTAQHGASVALTQTPISYFEEQNKHYTKRRNTLYEALSQCSFIEPVLPQGAFYVWGRIKDTWQGFNGFKGGWAATAMLLEHGVGSAPGDVFGPAGANHIRFSFSCADDSINLASAIISKL